MALGVECSSPSSMGGKDSLVPVEVGPTASVVAVLVFFGIAGLWWAGKPSVVSSLEEKKTDIILAWKL